jgi:DNA-directed RNA polymerase specialized sigma24 family protein
MTTTPLLPTVSARVAASTPARLDAEWVRLCADRAIARRLRRRPLAGCTSLADLLAAAGGGPRPAADLDDADVVVSTLMRDVAAGDGLAARVVLQRLLPGLVATATRRTRSHPWDRQPLLDDLVAEAWETILRYPIERRPRRVVGNLCRDIEYRCCVAEGRRRSSTSRAPLAAAGEMEVEAHGQLVWHAADELAVELVELGADRLGDDDRRLLGAIVSGERLDTIAAEMSVSERTVRNRRDRLVAELRRRAMADVA